MADPLHVVCPHCDAVNRLPSDRPATQGRCGRCKEALFPGHPLDVTPERFAQHTDRGDLPIVVDFWASWCGPCKMMAPAYSAVAARIEPRARLVKVDTEAHPDLAARFSIRSIPTVVVLKHGREVARQSGALDAASLQRWIEAQL